MTSYRTWMADCTEIHSQTLGQLCLPASHDSGTYDLSDTLTPDPSPELAKILNECQNIADLIDNIPGIGDFIPDPFAWISNAAFPAIRGLSTTTSRRVSDQLNDGIRCLDLRVYYDSSDPSNPQFYTYHGLQGSPMTDILSDIQSFLAGTSGEIVYVTMGHWCGFTASSQYDAFAQLVKSELGSYAYVQKRDSNGNFTNNPFNQTYTAIVSSTGQTQSTVLLVNDMSSDPVFWPQEFSPPNNDSPPDNSSVLAGYYTNTSDVSSVVSTQLAQFQSNQGQPLPFALYMTLTPQADDAYKIVISSLVSFIANFGASLLGSPLTWAVGKALNLIAAELAIYEPALFWTTLQELSLQIDEQLQSELVSQFQPLNPQNNQITFIYVDTYEATNVVDLAIQYSGGVLTNAPRMTQVYGVMNPYNNNLEMFGIGIDNCLYHAYYGSDGWNNWVQNFEDATFTAISVFGSPNFWVQNVEIFAIDESSTAWHNWYSSASQGWQPTWDNAFDAMPAPSAFALLFPITNFQNNNIELFAVDATGGLWHNCYSSNGWNGWTSNFCQAPAHIASVFGLTNEVNSTFELFAIDEEGTLWQTQWNSLSSWQSGWTNLVDTANNPFNVPASLLNAPAELSSSFAIMNATSGSLELFAVDTSGNLWHNQYDTNNNWSGWNSGFNGAPSNVATFHAVTNCNSNLEIFVTDDSGVLWHNWCAGGNWQPSWQESFNGAPVVNSVFGVLNTCSGALELYGLGDNNILWHCWYGSSSGWQPWDIFLSWG